MKRLEFDQVQLTRINPLIRNEGFAQGVEHYRKVILPVMVEEARKDEGERITRDLAGLYADAGDLKELESRLAEFLEALKGEDKD